MASIVVRSVLGPTGLPFSRTATSSLITGVRNQASTFASSSRVRLDFTRPRLAEENPGSSSTSVVAPEPGTLSQSTETNAPLTSAIPAEPTSHVVPSTTSTRSTPTPTARTPAHKPQFNLSSPSSSSSFPGKLPPGWRWEPEPPLNGSSDPFSPTHTLTVNSTRNNVLLTFTDRLGPLFPTISGGTGKQFKNAGRASYEAAHQAALKTFDKILGFASHARTDRVNVRVAFRGMMGQGREAVANALGGPEGQEVRRLVKRVEDRTPVKIGGTRARKVRRL